VTKDELVPGTILHDCSVMVLTPDRLMPLFIVSVAFDERGDAWCTYISPFGTFGPEVFPRWFIETAKKLA
jgi:hypothetical protein